MLDIVVYSNGEIELNISIDEELDIISVDKNCLITEKYNIDLVSVSKHWEL